MSDLPHSPSLKRKRSPSPTQSVPEAENSYKDSSELNTPGGSEQKATKPSSGNKTKKKELHTIVVNDDRYTCIPCRDGHRTGTCIHMTSPMVKINKPGRPSAGTSKSTKCKCLDVLGLENCICTFRAYMLVYIPFPGTGDKPIRDKEGKLQGTVEVDRDDIFCDKEGKQLDTEEARRRMEQLEKLDTGKHNLQRSRSRSSISTSTLSLSQAKPKAEADKCCNHVETVQQLMMAETRPQSTDMYGGMAHARQAGRAGRAEQVYHQPPVQASAFFHGCNCGAACSCAFCPQHANNQASLNLAQKHVATFIDQGHLFNANQALMQGPLAIPYNGNSCFPGAPISIPHDLSQLPTPAEFQDRFPQYRGGMVVPYGVRADGIPEAIHPQNSFTFGQAQHTSYAQPANQLWPDLPLLEPNNHFGGSTFIELVTQANSMIDHTWAEQVSLPEQTTNPYYHLGDEIIGL